MLKELSISFINGLLWPLYLAIISGLWFSSQTLAIVIGFAVIINLLIAAFSGVVIPIG